MSQPIAVQECFTLFNTQPFVCQSSSYLCGRNRADSRRSADSRVRERRRFWGKTSRTRLSALLSCASRIGPADETPSAADAIVSWAACLERGAWLLLSADASA